MSSIVYSFHWVRKSLDEKKRRHSELDESKPTTDLTQTKPSSSWLNQLFKHQTDNNNEQEYIHSNNFEFKFRHSIL